MGRVEIIPSTFTEVTTPIEFPVGVPTFYPGYTLMHPDSEFPLVELEWFGPFYFQENRFNPFPSAHLPEGGIEELADQSGIYIVIGEHAIHGSQALLYIGQAKNLSGRFTSQFEGWVQYQNNVQVYLAPVDDESLMRPIEALLIYSHSPANNSEYIGMGSVPEILRKSPVRIWNSGRRWRLFPEVSSLNKYL